MRQTLLVTSLLYCGCGIDPGVNPDPVQLSGSVMHNGKPISDVVLNFQATGAGVQAMLPIKNGTFRGSVVPGKYTFYITEGASASAFKLIPPKFHQGSLDRQFNIEPSQSTLTLNLD